MSGALFSCGGPHSSTVLGASGASWRAWLCEFGAFVEPSGRHFESVAKWYYHFPKACSDTGLLPFALPFVEPSGRHFEAVVKWYYHFPKACSDTGLLPM